FKLVANSDQSRPGNSRGHCSLSLDTGPYGARGRARGRLRRPPCDPDQYGELRKKLGKRPLRFVRRGSILVQRGNAFPRIPAALLGRFLPRLGPPASLGGPFFCRLDNVSAWVRSPCRNGMSRKRRRSLL